MSRNKSHHRAAYPAKLVGRLIKLLTYRGDTVLDPYNGSGTTTAVAARLGRNYIGIDNAPRYVDRARRRTARAKQRALAGPKKCARKSPADVMDSIVATIKNSRFRILAAEIARQSTGVV